MGRILPSKDYRICNSQPWPACVLTVVRWLRFGFLDCFCGRWWNMECIDSCSMSINGCPITGGS